jgi:signal transduction histidine kinase
MPTEGTRGPVVVQHQRPNQIARLLERTSRRGTREDGGMRAGEVSEKHGLGAHPMAQSVTSGTIIEDFANEVPNREQIDNAGWQRLLELMRRRPLATDMAMMVLFMVLLVGSLIATYRESTVVQRNAIAPWSYPLVVLGVALLVIRRRVPELQCVATCTLIVLALIGELPEGAGVGLMVMWISLYSLAAYGRRWRVVTRNLVTLVLVGLSLYFSILDLSDPSNTADGGTVTATYQLLFGVVFIVSAVMFGETMRIHRVQANNLAMRAEELEIERDRNAENAVVEERLRIARELHDVMAHHVTVIGVQASAADRTLTKNPDAARSALQSISGSSREIIEELQRLLGFLRSSQESAEPSPPQPMITDVGRLVADANNAGSVVTLSTEGPLDTLPGSVSLSAYRIVQEALTNVRKHAPDSKTTVAVTVSAHMVSVVVDTKVDRPSVRSMSNSGHGLVGMRERARLVGGTLRAGPVLSGWLVEAELPRMPGKMK